MAPTLVAHRVQKGIALAAGFGIGEFNPASDAKAGTTIFPDLVMAELPPGFKLADKYEIKSALGTGGMGTVYRAREMNLGRDVAIKIPNDVAMRTVGFMARFAREARTCAKLLHDNIVQIYEYHAEESQAYIAMEYVEGHDLKYFINHPPEDFRVSDLLTILHKVCDGLAYAHEFGVVHRDIKPGNVMIGTLGAHRWRVKIMDFGLAHLGPDSAMSLNVEDLTTAGEVLGTPSYMSPEQIRSDAVTSKSDIYALGGLIYYTFTREPPFSGPGLSVAAAHLTAEPPKIRAKSPRLPESLEQLIINCLEKDPERRPENCLLVASALQESLKPLMEWSMFDIWPGESMPVLSPQGQTRKLPSTADDRTMSPLPLKSADSTPASSSSRSAPIATVAEVAPSPRKTSYVALLAALGVVFVAILGGVAMLLRDSSKSSKSPLVSESMASVTEISSQAILETPDLSAAAPSPSPTFAPTPAASPSPPPTSSPRPTPTPHPNAVRLKELATRWEAMEKSDAIALGNFWADVFASPITEEFQAQYQTLGEKAAMQMAKNPTLTTISAGSFTQGRMDNDPNASFEEKPAHPVDLDSYEIGKYEVTAIEFSCFLNANPREAPSLYTPGEDNVVLVDASSGRYHPARGKALHPANGISWIAASRYTNWLSKETGQSYRLPTEAEWERAARGPQGFFYPWGNGAPNATLARYDDRRSGTVPVNSYPEGVSQEGCFHLAGNVAEWCLDWFTETAYQHPDRKNPRGPLEGRRRVVRGGGYDSPPSDLTSTRRGRLKPEQEEPYVGFRLVREP
jgi:serine/threonine protein kinase